MRKGTGTHAFPCSTDRFEQGAASILQSLVDRNLEGNQRLLQGTIHLSTQKGAYIDSLTQWVETFHRMSQMKTMDYQRLQWEHRLRYKHFLEEQHRRDYVITYRNP